MVDGGSHDGSMELARDNGIETYVQKKRGIRFAYIEAWPLIRGNLVITFSPGGDVLFVLPTPASEEAPPVPLPWSSQVPVSTDDSLRLQYVVEAFDANNLRVRVVNPGSGSWMFYSDVWHPSWRATVNGKPVPVYRADLALQSRSSRRRRERRAPSVWIDDLLMVRDAPRDERLGVVGRALLDDVNAAPVEAQRTLVRSRADK